MVNVWIPLRRATVFGLLLSVPVLFLHKQIEVIDEIIHMPNWAWIAVASGLVYLIARAHEFATELANRLFDRDFIRAERHLEAVGESILHARSLAEVERLLVNEPMRSLHLASAALFREKDGVYHRRSSAGWDADEVDALAADDPLLAERFKRSPTLSTPPAHRMPVCRTTSHGRFLPCRWATRGAASRFSSMAATRPGPILTAPNGASSAASPTTRKSRMRKSSARTCAGGSRCWKSSSRRPPSLAELAGPETGAPPQIVRLSLPGRPVAAVGNDIARRSP